MGSERQVRVRCWDCGGSGVKGHAGRNCWECRGDSTVLATLADPEVEARLTLADAYIAWYHGPQDHPTIDLCRARDRVEELMAADPQRAPEAGQGVGG